MYSHSRSVKRYKANRVEPDKTIFERAAIAAEPANSLDLADQQQLLHQKISPLDNNQSQGKFGLAINILQCASKEVFGEQPSLTDSINVPGSGSYTVEVDPSTFKHGGSDIQSVRHAMAMALRQVVYGGKSVVSQGNGVFRVPINDGMGYIVLRITGKHAKFFHYHWNYALDELL